MYSTEWGKFSDVKTKLMVRELFSSFNWVCKVDFQISFLFFFFSPVQPQDLSLTYLRKQENTEWWEWWSYYGPIKFVLSFFCLFLYFSKFKQNNKSVSGFNAGKREPLKTVGDIKTHNS